MQEGEQKGFSDLAIEEVQQVGNLCIRANQFEEEIQKQLKEINEGKGNPLALDDLLALLEQG